MSTNATATLAKNVAVVHEGDKIVLPIIDGKPMPKEEGITWLKRMIDDEETKQSVVVPFDGYEPLDALVAISKAIKNVYGWSTAVPTPGFFGSTPPHMISVTTGPNPGDRIQVPYGRLVMPGIDGFLEPTIQPDPMPKMYLNGQIKKKSKDQLDRVINEVKRVLKEESIYRGRAVKVSYKWQRPPRKEYDPFEHCPKFWRGDGYKEDDLILPAKVMSQLQRGLFWPIEAPQALRKIDVPLKRGVVLAGPYGVGKSLIAAVTTLKALRNGWTFIYGASIHDMEPALNMGIQYGPAVVLFEDADQAFEGERDDEMNKIINLLDGVDTKGKELITIFTTNHVEKINPVAMRPGRIDSFITVLPPDKAAAKGLILKYARGLLVEGGDIEPAAEELVGRNAAFIRETVERSKIAAVGRQLESGVPVEEIDVKGKVLPEDILETAYDMREHAKLLEPKAKGEKAAVETFVRVPLGHDGMDEIMSAVVSTNGRQ